MRQKRLLSLLVLLMTVVTGAWAESKPIGLNVEYAVGDVITSTSDVYVYLGEEKGTTNKMGVKITSTDQVEITTISPKGFNIGIDLDLYYLPDGKPNGGIAFGIPCFGESTGDATVVLVASGSGTLADPYVFAPGNAAPAAPKHLIKATHGKQTRSLEQPLPYATTVGELYEAVTGQSFSDLLSTMSALEMPLK